MTATAGKGKKTNKNRVPGMTVTDYSTEKAIRRGRGLSMDMGSPYVLPAGLQGSRESLHSLSRLHNADDRYRPATTFFGNDTSTNQSSASSRRGEDDSSSYTGSSGRGYRQEGLKNNMLRNARRMSRSMPPTQRDALVPNGNVTHIQVPERAMGTPGTGVSPQSRNPGLAVTTQPDLRDSYMSDGVGMRRSNNYLGAFIHSRDPSADLQTKIQSAPLLAPESLPSTPSLVYSPDSSRAPTPPAPVTLVESSRPPRLQSMQAPVELVKHNSADEGSDYGDDFKVTPPSPILEIEGQRSEPLQLSMGAPSVAINNQTHGRLEPNELGYDVQRLSMGARPLPPDDPSDNPEQRANRIRSFYKEYFDESKQAPAQVSNGYYEDYSQEYLADAAVYDSVAGEFVVGNAQSHAEPVTRRAMTPPPRAPHRLQGGQHRQAAMSSTSSPRLMSPGPRAVSSASAPFEPPRRGPQRKAMPPPAPLRILPTPHLLQEDSFAAPLDFAPPTSYKDRQAGTPTSPRGGMLPYSPSLPAHMPLVSSFQDLAVMPSP